MGSVRAAPASRPRVAVQGEIWIMLMQTMASAWVTGHARAAALRSAGAVTLVTPAESPETLKRFYEQCRPPGLWGPVRASMDVSSFEVQSTSSLLVSSVLGILSCLTLVLATNDLFVSSWPTFATYFMLSIGFSAALIVRILKNPSSSGQPVVDCSAASSVACSPVN